MSAAAAGSHAYPSVYRLTTRSQWLVFVAAMLALVGATVPSATSDLQARGYDVHWWQLAIRSALGVVFLLAITRQTWRLLDAVPFTTGRRVRNGALRLALAGAYGIVDGTWGYGVILVTTWIFAIDPRVLAEPNSSWLAQLLHGVFGFSIIVLAHTILQRTHEIRQREMLERSLVSARLQSLSLKLQPHFLFNTLNAIAALMRDDPHRAEKMLVRLSDLLRITLRSGTTAESLQRELEHLDLYLDLQTMRFGNRLTVVRDIDPATLGARVPCMLLQPLVENALTHGIGPRAGPGRVELTARRDRGTLVLRVRDNGVGLPPACARTERTGVGTTRARLSAMFDGAQSFTLAPADGGGTVAEVRIPFTR